MAAGGTGGHVFPALALAEEMRRRGHEVVWAGRRSGLERSVAEKHRFGYEPVPAAGLMGSRRLAQLRWPLVMGIGMLRACRMMRRVRPAAVVAGGGYVGVAPLFCARTTGRDYFLLEQNRIPGRATRLFANGARECYLTFPLERPLGGNCVVTGSPLRVALSVTVRQHDGRTVLVLGGSGGARALNLAAFEAARQLGNCRFIVLTGTRDYHSIRALGVPDNCELIDFTDEPERLYRRATLAVSRAGGLVLSELVACGIPAILVPYPYAADRHQAANADYLESVGAAQVLVQERLPGLTAAIATLIGDPSRLQTMSAAARSIARPTAASTVAERIERCLAA